MDTKKNYKVSIFDDHYFLVSDEPHEHIAQAAVLVDSLMKEIADKSSSMDTKKVAVLAALRIASSVLNLENKHKESVLKEERLIEVIDQALCSIPTSV